MTFQSGTTYKFRNAKGYKWSETITRVTEKSIFYTKDSGKQEFRDGIKSYVHKLESMEVV